MKQRLNTKNWFGGILSGLAVGGILDLILGTYLMWIIMAIFGFSIGYIFDLRKKIKDSTIITEIDKKDLIKLLAKLMNKEKLTNAEFEDAKYIRHKLMGLEK